METPKFEVARVQRDGKPSVELIVRYATPELRNLLDTLGYVADCTIANRRSIVCTSPAEVDAARNPLAPLFDKTGAWLGKAVA